MIVWKGLYVGVVVCSVVVCSVVWKGLYVGVVVCSVVVVCNDCMERSVCWCSDL